MASEMLRPYIELYMDSDCRAKVTYVYNMQPFDDQWDALTILSYKWA